MKFHELDLNKKCRRKTWDKDYYICFSENGELLSLFYTELSVSSMKKEIRDVFLLSKSDLETNDWEYLEEKKYQVLYKHNSYNYVEISENKYMCVKDFTILKRDIAWAYLIDENGDKVK